MKRKPSLTVFLLVAALGLGAAHAQTLRNSTGPAEIPPPSFTGKQYVDSKGCVFVRAGFDGAVTWVPRASRSREVLCGFTPSLAGSGSPAPVMAAATPRANPAPVATQPRPVGAAPAPRIATTPVRSATPPVYRSSTPTYRAPAAPVRIQTAPPAPLRSAPAPTTGYVSACPGMSSVGKRYMTAESGYPVRCGPQGEFPTANGSYGAPAYAQLPPPPEIAPPPGYRAAFSDGRFNPNRGKQTREGFAQMRLVWTSGVPRRLVEQGSGREVSHLFPFLKWPFLSMRQQNQYMLNKGTRFVYSTSGTPAPAPVARSTTRLSTKAVAPVRAAPAPGRATVAPAGHRYVQVGLFGVPQNAQNTAARLQRMGLPVRIGNYTKAGKTYRIVMAGPFADPGQLRAGLSAARQAGFADAFTRR